MKVDENHPWYVNLTMHETRDECLRSNEFHFPSTLSTAHPSLEELTFRRVVTVEKESLYPILDFVFIRGHPICINDEGGPVHNATYVRLDDVSRPAHGSFSSLSSSHDRERGYLLFAFKSMDDMHSANFLSQWKAWTGAKYLYHMLPASLHIDFMSFFKKVSGVLDFEFVMIAHVPNLLIEAASALNLLHYMRQKVCAHIAAYKVTSFELSGQLAKKLHISRDFCDSVYTTCMRLSYNNNTATLSFPGEAAISVTRGDDTNGDKQRGFNEWSTSRKNSLARTISIYDFPSIDESSERAFSHCYRPLIILPQSTQVIHPLDISIPSSTIVTPSFPSLLSSRPLSDERHRSRSVSERKTLTALPLSLLISHPGIIKGASRKALLTTTTNIESARTRSSSLIHTSPISSSMTRPNDECTGQSNATIVGLNGGDDEENYAEFIDDDQDEDDVRFRLLRQKYFNSPEYDRSERPRKEEEEDEEKTTMDKDKEISTLCSSPAKNETKETSFAPVEDDEDEDDLK